MSNLEHLIENGLCRLNEGKSYREWLEIMQQDCNWENNENITLDNLWEICQYVIFTWNSEKTFVRCKDCKHLFDGEHTKNCCDVLMEKAGWLKEISVSPDWFCADWNGGE